MSQQIAGSVALVSGANRGIGRALVEALLERGAARVYAGARVPAALDELVARHPGRVVALPLDVTDAASVEDASRLAPDVTMLVNNAGTANAAPLLEPAALDALQRDVDVNVTGTLRVTQAFAPALVRARGTVVNLASVASLVNFALLATYSVAKAGTHSLTQGLRATLAPQGVSVLGVYPGPVDTDMAKDLPFEKTPPAAVAHEILDAIERGDEDVFPDGMSKQFGAGFFADPKGLERSLAGA